MMPIFLSPV